MYNRSMPPAERGGRGRPIQSSGLGLRAYLRAAREIAGLTWRATPWAIVLQLLGAVITAVLPIAMTWFAALVMTALGEAAAGDPDAGGRAITFVIVAAVLGLALTAWRCRRPPTRRRSSTRSSRAGSSEPPRC